MGTSLASLLARLLKKVGRWAAWPIRCLVRQRDVEFWATALLNVPTRMVICQNVAPAIDIDVDESYRVLVADGEDSYRRVARYLGRLPLDGFRPNLKIIAGGRQS
jgi:hypothetical protein